MLIDISSALMKVVFVAVIIWFITLIISIISLYKRTDILKPVKIFWAAVIFFAPVVGLIFYLIYGIKRKRLPNERGYTDKNITRSISK
jgi:phosphotransferase system  glucose/maltose/N-acetylglucosamine-specific IIC component